MVAGHNLLDGVRSAHPLWVMRHARPVLRRYTVAGLALAADLGVAGVALWRN